MNGFDTTQGLPSQRNEGWWGKAIGALQEDPGMWSSILGRGAQVFSARDPQSWQYQLGGLGAEIGQAHKMALTAEAGRKRRDDFRNTILKALGLDVSLPGEDVPKAEEKSRLDYNRLWGGREPQTLLDMFLGPRRE